MARSRGSGVVGAWAEAQRRQQRQRERSSEHGSLSSRNGNVRNALRSAPRPEISARHCAHISMGAKWTLRRVAVRSMLRSPG